MIRDESVKCPAVAGVAVGAMLSPVAVGGKMEREGVTDKCI